jgi:hypothetical protein
VGGKKKDPLNRPDKIDLAILTGLAFGYDQVTTCHYLDSSETNDSLRLRELREQFGVANTGLLVFKFIHRLYLEVPGYFPRIAWVKFREAKRCLHELPLSKSEAVVLARSLLAYTPMRDRWHSLRSPDKDSICAKAGTDGPLLVIVAAAAELGQLRAEHFDRAAWLQRRQV